MPSSKQPHLVSFRIDPPTWKKFLTVCRSKDMTGSQVLRHYINLVATKKFQIIKPFSHKEE